MDIYQDGCLDLQKALDDESADPIDLPLFVLKVITKDFSLNQLIGSGGSGSVYKGELPNGMVVAVKKIHNTIAILEEDFQREITCLMEVKHNNIVRFLGYCYETQHVLIKYEEKRVLAEKRQILLCFEYLSKGSLANYLTEASSRLSWKVRYQIIKGICEGVAHLHQKNIVHRNLKPQNILLDDSMVPKIAGFGLSRLLGENKSGTITTNIVGTRPYMAPEFMISGTITLKTDIYSLGVTIIEILIGSKECPSIDKVLETWANIFGTSESQSLLQQVKVCAEIGINCMDDNPMKRPDIKYIISSLKEKDDISSVSSFVRSVSSTSTGQSVDEVDIYQDSRCLDLEKALNDESVNPIDVPFLVLKAITKDFSFNQLIGSGGFGSVYKGELPNGMVVAVKKLHNTIDVLKEGIQNEIACLIKAKHKNIVRCLGYCSQTEDVPFNFEGKLVLAEKRQLLLCFEYLSKGSLDRYLTETSSSKLPWKVRYQIIKGICEGVGHLHQQNIIHRDLKPQNILLDDSMVPKIADFGISRLLGENKSGTITKNRAGTLGYSPHEFWSSGTITLKTDIYSLGVIINEIIMGCKECPSIDKVLETWRNIFGTAKNQSLLQVEVCAEIGIKCMDDDPKNRPDIQYIISILEEKDISSVSRSFVRSVSSTLTTGQV